MTLVVQRILECAKEKNTSDAEICRVLKAKKDKVYTWKTGRSNPTTEEVNALADYFDVSVAYLMGEVNDPVQKEKPLLQEQELIYDIMEASGLSKEEILNLSDGERNARFQSILDVISANKDFVSLAAEKRMNEDKG